MVPLIGSHSLLYIHYIPAGACEKASVESHGATGNQAWGSKRMTPSYPPCQLSQGGRDAVYNPTIPTPMNNREISRTSALESHVRGIDRSFAIVVVPLSFSIVVPLSFDDRSRNLFTRRGPKRKCHRLLSGHANLQNDQAEDLGRCACPAPPPRGPPSPVLTVRPRRPSHQSAVRSQMEQSRAHLRRARRHQALGRHPRPRQTGLGQQCHAALWQIQRDLGRGFRLPSIVGTGRGLVTPVLLPVAAGVDR